MEENEKLKIGINSENDVSQQNGNAEVKPKNKKLTIVLVSVIIVLLIAIGVCVGLWFAGDTTKIINNKEEVVKEEENTSKKLDETKPWVYDAEYGKNYSEKRVEPEYTYDVYASTNKLKAPYININSEDANKANSEIKKIYEEYYAMFGKNAGSDYLFYIPNMEYLYYENNNILSVVMIHYPMITGTSYGEYNIKTYNFNLNTLKFATFEELSKIGGYTKADIDTAIEKLNNTQDGPEGKLEFKDVFLAKDGKMYAVCIGGTDSGGRRNQNFNTVINLSTGKDEFIGYTLFNEDTDKSSSKDESKKNDNSATNSIQDFSIMKNAGFANTVYETEKKQGEMFYRISFDSNCNPTIYSEAVGIQPYATYNKFYNIKYDVAAGTTYITFDYKLLNETEDGGKGEIKYSNVADNTFISIKLNYPPTDYVTLQKATTSNNTSTKNTDSQSKVYAKYYMEKIKQLDFVNDSTKYGLLYINQSDIPYLVVDTSGDLSIYKINNNTVETLKERDSYGTHGRDGYDYIEGTKIMRDYCTFEEGYAYEIYDELFNYKYCVECTFNGEYRYSNNSGDKKTITEEEFDNLSYKNSKFKHLRDIANKNKEEMIKFLENQ